ncbi:MAG: alpha-amylase family glycosyl hydrolase [Chlamydiia bacterium]
MDQEHLTETSFGVFKENTGFRFLVFAEGIQKISLTINDIEYPVEKAPLRSDTYTFFAPHLRSPFSYVYNIIRDNDFFPNLLDPFCPFTDQTGTKSIHREFDPFTFKHSSPKHPPEKLIIYEICARGFTKDASSKLEHPEIEDGTIEGIIEKLDYIKNLGVTAIELMPITLFSPYRLWGYMPRSFLALAPHLSADNNPSLSLKKLVDAAHEKGLEVFVDLVFNHTDMMENTLYPFSENIYLKSIDVTGCGNTVNANHPWVKNLLLSSVRLFVEEYRVDGIRFDLGLALCRGENGEILDNPPFIHDFENLYKHKIKIFYEPWDAAGYRLTHFPSRNGFIWDDRIRDTIRRFAKMDEGQVPALHDLINSPNSVKMISCHDGFTLYDLVSYDEKHNWVNGYKNKDGHNGNYSSNCGIEGETDNKSILTLRFRRAESLVALLFCFSGPLLLKSGDELLNTQYGNNNPFNQDNRISYLEWDRMIYPEMLSFIRKLIKIYLNSPLSNPQALIQFHGKEPNQVAFGSTDHLFALSKTDERGSIFIAINSWKDPIEIELPPLENGNWEILLSTSESPLHLNQNTLIIAKTTQK